MRTKFSRPTVLTRRFPRYQIPIRHFPSSRTNFQTLKQDYLQRLRKPGTIILRPVVVSITLVNSLKTMLS